MSALLVQAWLVLTLTLTSSEWPHWGGPRGDFVVPDAQMPLAWGSGGPVVLWRRPIGEGYASVVVAGGRAYVADHLDGRDRVLALDARTGGTVWTYTSEVAFDPRYDLSEGPGPRATPALADGRLFFAGMTGVLTAIDAGSGRRLWQRDLMADFGASFKPRGFASSPVVWRDRVLVQIGGTAGAVVALRADDGHVVWRSGQFVNSYASPVLVSIRGRPHLLVLTGDDLIAVDPESGTERWRHPHHTDLVAATASPLWMPELGLIFVSSAYGGGSRVVEVAEPGATSLLREVWAHQRVRLHHGNAVEFEGMVVTSSGDTGPSPISALDARTGELLWRDRAINRGTFVRIGRRLLALDEDGTVSLLAVGREGVSVLTRTPMLNGVSWTPPTVVGSTVFLRNRRDLLAFALPRAAPAGS